MEGGKVQQVLELAKFLEANARLWLPDGTPRILGADEAIDLIEQARREGRLIEILASTRAKAASGQ